jgi:hypothetical protein
VNVATVKFVVYGDTHEEILEKVNDGLITYLQIDPEDLSNAVSYELLIEKDDEMSSDSDFKAVVIARVK